MDGSSVICPRHESYATRRSLVDLKEEKDIDSPFTHPKTSALLDTIKGQDDFERIAFLACSS